ncbi:MAG TPA: efflux RND transporter periplasmic adaptor subunit [Bryobacteraceae bacterium]|nr:efflux RND transporter periplasmic adaptor subunit [Bryobacteraceae bacterium]
MDSELKSLRIDRSQKRPHTEPSRWATRWIIIGIAVFVLLGAGRFAWTKLNAATEVETVRVRPASVGGPGSSDPVILNATGYIIAAHKIEVASKVVGKVAWIGVDKGDHVKEGQVLVRLEDDEYRAQLLQAQGQLANLKARLAELENGSRPEEIARANADMEQARADMANAQVTLNRTIELVKSGVMSKQTLDDAQSRFDQAQAKFHSLERTYDLEKLGPRKEEIEAARAQVEQAQGNLDYAKTQLDNTIIRAPVTGTILERNVEKGEFVTTGFVGDKGAKGYVVSLANLNDLQVELDINQNDFAKLGPKQRGVVTTDAYPDRKYQGYIEEISPEANRQKATVQVKVQIEHPDDYLRPEMNASVAFLANETSGKTAAPSQALVVVPSSAIRDNTVFVIVDEHAVRKQVKVAGTTADGVQVESGLIGGEDLIVNPPADLKDGQKVRPKQV